MFTVSPDESIGADLRSYINELIVGQLLELNVWVISSPDDKESCIIGLIYALVFSPCTTRVHTATKLLQLVSLRASRVLSHMHAIGGVN